MGHQIEYMTFPKKATKKEMYAERAMRLEAEGERDYDGTLMSNDSGFTLHDVICESYDDAVEKIRKYDKGFYDDHGVLYKSYKGKSKVMLGTLDKIKETRQKKAEYIRNNDIHNRKSDTIACPKCGSRLALAYLHGNSCPLCRTDLRSNTVMSRIDSFDKKIRELEKKYDELERKRPFELMWLVKLEFHV